MGAGCVSSQLASVTLWLFPRAIVRPYTRPWFAPSGGLQHWPEKTIKGCNDGRQICKVGPSCTSNECSPLDLLLSVVPEFAGQCERTFVRDLDAPSRERRRDREPH